MVTVRQELGTFGEQRIVQECPCPRCKRVKTLVRLPPNFKCADVICDFCGYLAQVKTSRTKRIEQLPKVILGGAWGPQSTRMAAGIYFPLYVVLVDPLKQYAIYYLSADLQTQEMFRPRKPLSETARRAGWQGFIYDMQAVEDRLVRLR